MRAVDCGSTAWAACTTRHTSLTTTRALGRLSLQLASRHSASIFIATPLLLVIAIAQVLMGEVRELMS